MESRSPMRGRRALALVTALSVAGMAGVIGVRAARASDHQDNPLSELNPKMDMSDVYAFPGASADRVVLVMNSSPLMTTAGAASASFDPDILYQFKVDNTGDAKEDRVIQVTFKGTGTGQTIEVRGPMAPPVQGAMMNTVASADPVVSGPINQTLGTSAGVQVFAGSREDPFFLDLEQFLRILPDRRPSTGPLSQIPDNSNAGTFRAAGAAVDALKGTNVLSIVIELPTTQLTAGGTAKLGIWGTISR